MSDWYISSSTVKPAALDNFSSPTIIYERRNFVQKTQTEDMGEGDPVETTYWEYEERTMTADEYSLSRLVAERVEIRHESDIIDEYTDQLIEEGLI